MNEEQIKGALRSAAEDEPLFRAFFSVLDAQISDETDHALLSDITAEGRAYNCGRAAALASLKELLLSYRTNRD